MKSQMTLRDYLTGKEKIPRGFRTEWLPFCSLAVKSGSIWAGDPWLPNADDGCVVDVPNGNYRVEAIGGKRGRYRVVLRLRVCLDSAYTPDLGDEVGETGTDSAMIGVCDIEAFEAAYRDGGAKTVQKAINALDDEEFGILTVPEYPDAVMPFVPTGSDGSGPVYALLSGGGVVGIELDFSGEDEDG